MDELINRVKNGDTNAYKELIDSIKDILYRVAKSRLDNEDDIFDAINDTVFKAYKNLAKLKHNEYFKTWIIRILINECNKIYKKNERHHKLMKKLEENEYHNTNNSNPLTDVENKIIFEKLIEILNHDEKTVFVLYFYGKYDTTEIAKLLKKSPNTIKSRLRRGKEKIAKYLEEKGGIDYER